MAIYPSQIAQIKLLKANKALTTIFTKYFDYTNIFLSEFIIELLEYTNINNHVIKLENNKQPSYSLIYSPKPVRLEILKVYIKINLANSFIKSFKSLIKASMLLDYKLNKSFCFYVNYCNLYNLTIKNKYLSFLISKLLNCLNRPSYLFSQI